MAPRLLLITPATSYSIGRYLAAAKRLQLDLHLACDQPLAAQVLDPAHNLLLDFSHSHAAVRTIVARARGQAFDALLGVDEASCGIAAQAAQALNLAHNPPAAVATAHNKLAFRQRLAQAGLPGPGIRVIAPTDDPGAVAREIDYPCVLKPLQLSAGRGVIRANNSSEFVAAARRIEAILRHTPGQPREILVEEYIPGPEFALEGLLENGHLHTLALFDKPQPLRGPFFEENIYVTPSRLLPDQCETLRRTTADACAGLGLHRGPVHAELRLNAGGAWLIELATRAIGGRCSGALRFGNGVVLEELILRNALGRPAAHLPREPGASGVMMIPVPGPGRLESIRGLDEARRAPGISGISIDITIGTQLVPLPEGDRYPGFIFARGRRRDQVIQYLRQAHSMLRFAINNDPEQSP